MRYIDELPYDTVIYFKDIPVNEFEQWLKFYEMKEFDNIILEDNEKKTGFIKRRKFNEDF